MSDFRVVILSFNHPEITAATVQSVLPLVAPEKITLVHNGSLPVHQSRIQQMFPQIKHQLLARNKGFSGGANAGLEFVFREGVDWILFLTNDCRLTEVSRPESPPALIAPLIWGRKVGFVDSIGGNFDVPRAKLSHCKSKEEFENAKNPYVPGTAFWIHREVFLAAKGFDESLGTYWEDVDFSMKVKASHYPLQLDSKTQMIHAIGKTNHKDSHYTTYLYQRNRHRISLKYAQGSLERFKIQWTLARNWSELGLRFLLRRDWKRLQQLWQAIKDS